MASEVTVHELYGGDVTITFEKNPWHTYKLNGIGERLISATKVTGQLDKSQPLMYWAVKLMKEFILDWIRANPEEPITKEILMAVVEEGAKQHITQKGKAADIGDMVHDFAEAHSIWKAGLGDKPSVKDLPKEAMKGINGYLDWVAGKQFAEDRVERVLYSRTHGWVGKTDRTAVINDVRTILDYKTANGLYLEYLLQLTLYWYAAEEEELYIKVKERFGKPIEEMLQVPGWTLPTELILSTQYKQGLVIRFDKETGEFHEHTISRDLYLILVPIAIKLYEVCNLLRNPDLNIFLKQANPNKR